MPEKARVKITVIKIMFNRDLVDEYLVTEPGYGPCKEFREGQEFVLEQPFERPEGFCSWAWADIRSEIVAMYAGASFHWIKQPGTTIAGCTDFFRPVIFRVERIE